MFFKSVKVWLFFGIGVEIGIDVMAQTYDYNILQFEIIKLPIFIICYIALNALLVKKKIDENTVFGVNCGSIIILASLMGAISFAMILKSREGIGWILFLLSYIGMILLCFMMWKKSSVSEEDGKKEEKPNDITVKVLGAGSALFSISFIRTASEDTSKIVYTILCMVLLWLLLFFGLLPFIKYKNDLKNIFLKKNEDSCAN